ncbi:MAG: Pyrimidine-specific ribonucleoside hydrolase RihB [Candidatus Celerinatantimonas neptuna]|nr:MAG: Pyrimidine-specific ribonucleoside hydrolase RihB [Candidatus Celerinatantimonas neptuna]
MASKIILDTDPGIDDAMAILFAESHPFIELLAITTVYGNSTIEHTTQNALYLKDTFKLKADVAKGTDHPIQRKGFSPAVAVHGENGFGDLDVPELSDVQLDTRPAYQYIIDTIKANPGEITLVAVGPLTNLALALQADLTIASLVKEVVVMGGAFGIHNHYGNVTAYAEANIHNDPDAADLVFSAQWPVVIVGLDVTEESFFTGEYLANLRQDSGFVGQFLWDVSRYYLRFYSQKTGRDGCHVHDSSAIAYVIAPELFKVREGAIGVICEGERAGMTVQKQDGLSDQFIEWEENPSAQQVCVDVDEPALLTLYRESMMHYAKRF